MTIAGFIVRNVLRNKRRLVLTVLSVGLSLFLYTVRQTALRELVRGRTVLMVEHNLSVVSALADRITVLARGKVLAEGDYATISTDPRVVESYIGGGSHHG